MDRIKTGKEGENIACVYLEEKGYAILDRNYRTKFGEIDIVAKSPEGILLFVEVKTITRKESSIKSVEKSYPQSGNGVWQENSAKNDDFKPEDQISPAKSGKAKRIAGWYANEFPHLLSKKGWRIDVVAIVKSDDKFYITHYQNALF